MRHLFIGGTLDGQFHEPAVVGCYNGTTVIIHRPCETLPILRKIAPTENIVKEDVKIKINQEVYRREKMSGGSLITSYFVLDGLSIEDTMLKIFTRE